MKNEKPDGVIRAPWLFDTAPFEIVEGVYYVGNQSVSAHLFDTGAGLLLLDTAYPQTAYLLLESIRELGFDPHDIRWILHTHAHIDHFGATRFLVEKYGCQTYLPKADLPLMTERSELNYVTTHHMAYDPPHDCYFETDVAVQPGDVLTFGNIQVECHDASGHTPGTMAYLFRLPGGLRAIMHGGIGLNTLASQYANRYGLGDAWRRAYAASLERLSALEADVVLGNHPQQADVFGKRARRTAEYNPFVDASEWGRFLARTKERFEQRLRDDPL